ncbi:MAG TPA: SRPBCC domain-containing protein, partial [Longimicrobiales bacterium]|nr:SRPBCC domain-containing protein [Longimicrobiales bacterium]
GPPVEGTVTVYDEPRMLAYQWREGEVESNVKLELRAKGEGTHLIVDHTGLPLKEARGFAAGWHSHFDWLVLVLTGQGASFDQERRFRELAARYGYEVRPAEVS